MPAPRVRLPAPSNDSSTRIKQAAGDTDGGRPNADTASPERRSAVDLSPARGQVKMNIPRGMPPLPGGRAMPPLPVLLRESLAPLRRSLEPLRRSLAPWLGAAPPVAPTTPQDPAAAPLARPRRLSLILTLALLVGAGAWLVLTRIRH